MQVHQTCIVGLLCLLWLPWTATAQVHHHLDVTLQPDSAGIEVRDTVTLTTDYPSSLTFSLHPALKPQLQNSNATITELPAPLDLRSPLLNPSTGVAPRRYRVDLERGERSFTLSYTGSIAHALNSQGEEYARSFQETQGIISPLGVFLSGASAWYPDIENGLITFDLEVDLPEGWKSMSQGEPVDAQAAESVNREHWRATTPQEEIYLIAGPFSAYSSRDRGVTAMVLLRAANPVLADKYLETTHQYIALYNELIGPYPFKKFAMVENFWETGYGMPSFTLLGSRVIRLPFILHSSYPHEILHNWWGNGVYVDYDSGNWAEGLTSYLADHLIKEQRGSGVEYRRNTLQKYTDYVRHQDDFPLTAFRSRHSARTEAVGYGKTLMLFHMLRRHIGNAAFKQGLRTFYRQHRFELASFNDLQSSFSAVAGEPLNDFFQQWVQRSGAPQISVSKARIEPEGAHYRMFAEIEQIQPGPAYRFELPVAIHMHGIDKAYQTDLNIRHRQQTVNLKLPARPMLLQVDPEFDVFRRLHRNEIPPAVSQAMGARQVTVVLSDNAPADLKQAYQALAHKWRKDKPDQVEVVYDIELQALPDDRTVWLIGWHNRFRPQLNAALKDYDFEPVGAGVRIAETTLTPQTHSVAVLGRQPDNHEQALGWLAAHSPAAATGLGRKLPHYGRYSYLAFTGTEPDNVLKGQWPVVNSPLTVQLGQHNGTPKTFKRASLAPRQALVHPVERFSTERMQRDITFLADQQLAGRALGTAGLETAADYIARQLEAAQLAPGGDHNSYYQIWQQSTDDPQTDLTLKNVVAILPGSDPGYAGQSLVIGAHYDHLGLGEHGGRRQDQGKIHPGADDNASGIAVLLELARSLQGKSLPRTLVFVAFTGEENGLLGSRHYIRHSANYPADGIIAMLNLDTVGRLNDRPLILFGTGTADEWVHIFRGAGYVTGVPVQMVADDFGASDQTAFIEAGIPAVQFFSGNHQDVHRPADTPDKLDYEGLTRVARVLDETVRYLGERPESLQSTLAATQHKVPATRSSPRRVSFGSVPDFTWNGNGVRLEDVRADTPAEHGGLRKGDIIIKVNKTPIADIRSYSDALKKLDPGDTIQVRFLRDGVEKTLSTQVTER